MECNGGGDNQEEEQAPAEPSDIRDPSFSRNSSVTSVSSSFSWMSSSCRSEIQISSPEIEEIPDYRWLLKLESLVGIGNRRAPASGTAPANSFDRPQAPAGGHRRINTMGSIKLFSWEEIKKATNNFDPGRLIGKTYYVHRYKGFVWEISDDKNPTLRRLIRTSSNQPVLIKKPLSPHDCVGVVINEISILSRINHRNVAKLIGICLKNEENLFSVHEFYPNGTLEDNLLSGQMPWEIRLKVATEIAGALSYMHSSLPDPIIHRNINPDCIHLDADYTAKIFDFELANSVPSGETYFSGVRIGKHGFMAPEYALEGHSTCKADVYSFGVLLVSLLTGKTGRNYSALAQVFISSIRENTLEQIFDKEVADAATVDQMKHVARLAAKCLELRIEERPSMTEVTMVLERLRSSTSPLPNIALAEHHICGHVLHFQSNSPGDVYRKLQMWMHNRQDKWFQSFISDPIEDLFGICKIYTMEEIRVSTSNFDSREILAKGKNIVFRGRLPDGKLCAIKRSLSHDSANEALNEIHFLSQLRHKNIVRLLGFCIEAEYPITIHEYMPNGALSRHIPDNSMPWERRLSISTEIAWALSYLHNSLSAPIIHGDIKDSNIFLDDEYNVKVSGFRSASYLILNKSEDRLSPVVHGTSGSLTCQGDAFNFGVVLAQLLTGEAAVLLEDDTESKSLSEDFIQSTKSNLLDHAIVNKFSDETSAGRIKVVVDIVQKCLSITVEERPSMTEIAMKLEQLRNGRVNLEKICDITDWPPAV